VKLDNFGEAILRFRREIGIGLGVATLLMAYWATQVDISTRFIDFFPAQHRNVILAERFSQFGGDETLVLMLVVKHGDIFNLATMRKVQKITQEVDWLPDVIHQEVFSLASYRIAYAQAVPGGLNITPFMYLSSPDNQDQVQVFKQRIFAHREQLRHLISDDNKSTLITASFNEGGVALDRGQLFKEIRRIAANNRDPDHDIYIAGEPVVRGYAYYYFPAIVAIFFTACLVVVLVL
jgi:predicted RND superfamily exporter protein